MVGLALGAAARAATPSAPAADTAPPTSWKRASERLGFDVTVGPREGPPRIGVFQPWVVSLHDRHGRPVHPARIVIGGGMPAHAHGLPTRPQVTQYLGEGRYLVEGVRFNMAGEWVWDLTIETPSGLDRVRFDLSIDY
jgi:hypothetical protein